MSRFTDLFQAPSPAPEPPKATAPKPAPKKASKPAPAPVIMNNSSSKNTTQMMPMKADPRPNSRGSALDNYIERTATF